MLAMDINYKLGPGLYAVEHKPAIAVAGSAWTDPLNELSLTAAP